MGNMKDKVDMRLVRAYAPMCIVLAILCLVPRHAGMPSWIKWSIGVLGVLSFINCFVTLADMKKKASIPAPNQEEEKKTKPDM